MSQDLKRAREIAAQTVTEIRQELDSPALKLADWLVTLADHLRANPQLARVNPCAMTRRLQVASYTHLGEPDEAAALLLWHDSLVDPQIIAYHWENDPTSAGCKVIGRTAAGVELTVWDVVSHLGELVEFEGKARGEVAISCETLERAAKAVSS